MAGVFIILPNNTVRTLQHPLSWIDDKGEFNSTLGELEGLFQGLLYFRRFIDKFCDYTLVIQNDNLSNITNLSKGGSRAPYLDKKYERFFNLLDKTTKNFVFLWKHRELLLSRFADKLSKDINPYLTNERDLLRFFFNPKQTCKTSPTIISSIKTISTFHPNNYLKLIEYKKKSVIFYVSALLNLNFILNFLSTLALLDMHGLVILPAFRKHEISDQCHHFFSNPHFKVKKKRFFHDPHLRHENQNFLHIFF